MNPSQIDLVAFDPAHLPGALTLSQQASWPHRLEDWRLALALSRGIVALDPDGGVVGTAIMTPYGDTHATINMVIVDTGHRGRGLGRRLMDAVLRLAGDRVIRLIATQDGVPLYEKLGFMATGRVAQHQGVPTLATAWPTDPRITSATPLCELLPLDRQAFGADRSRLFTHLFELGQFHTLAADGSVLGFAGRRAFGRGQVIGPVVAATPDDARNLIGPHLSANPGAFLRVDTFEETGLSPWLQSIGLARVGGGIAMQRGGAPSGASAQPARTFALANQAFG